MPKAAAPRVILGIGGGIAAYKSAELARLLVQQGYEVQPVMTRAATEFLTPLTLSSLTHKRVITSLFAPAGQPEATLASAIEHIGVALENDLLLVAPATADLLAQFAQGLAGDFLTTMHLAFPGPVLLAPAMNTNMWNHPATQANVALLRARGYHFVGPAAGELACGMEGPGRLAEPAAIAAAAAALLDKKHDLAGETILLTAGPTQEPIDPVRVITNRSSGKMGYALAQRAQARGARVILVSGPVALSPPANVELLRVETAAQMYDAVMSRLAEVSVFIGVAAVADYRPARPAAEKLKKCVSALAIELEPTTDILAAVGRDKGHRLVVGFAAETGNLLGEAERKREAKNCDLVVANLVGAPGAGFEGDENEVVLIRRGQQPEPVARADKTVIADRILDAVADLRARQA
ncbi:MAG: bifunctional phosphopantothenoylcysteine decarboxylase/phosphopantothenate--cysteine ligase CoaBC [Acidobacteriota bacterium]